MAFIEAVFQGGVFKPLGEVDFAENQRVTLSVQTHSREAVAAWLARVQQTQQKIVAERGFFPDSTLDIAEDRMRDE